MHELNLIYLLALICLVNCQQRVVPGINPQHYQQVPVQQQQYQHPQQPVQYQQQQQHPPQQQQQHLPPGTPPQQYQQQPPQQQQQFQQVPVQQQQQHQQQPPPQQAQAHHAQHQQPQQVLNAGNIQQERAHIQEHMQVPIDTSKMSEAELQFHYFKMHDSDNNNKLDGCELIKSLIHWHDPRPHENDEHHDEKDDPRGVVYTDDNLAQIIEYVLTSMDANNDGYVDYAEYRKNEHKLET